MSYAADAGHIPLDTVQVCSVVQSETTSGQDCPAATEIALPHTRVVNDRCPLDISRLELSRR